MICALPHITVYTLLAKGLMCEGFVLVFLVKAKHIKLLSLAVAHAALWHQTCLQILA